MNQDIQVDCLPYTDWPIVKQHWETLSHQFSPPSIFLTTDWTETWINIFGEQLHPKILVFRVGSTVVGMCLLVARTTRYGPLAVQVLHINAAGEDEADETCIAYNGILALPQCEEMVGTALGKFVLASKWDELHCDGFRPGEALDASEKALVGFQRVDTIWPSQYINLCALRNSGQDYISTLGTKTRRNIRSDIRKYVVEGELRVRAAKDPKEALVMLTELARLHQERWSERGKPGVFSSQKFRHFHKELIQRMFSSGAIQVLQVNAGSSSIGYLYNLVYENKVYCYQSGYNYADKKFSPGLVTFACAVEYNINIGLAEFDFLSGDYEYKKRLSTNQRDVTWTVFKRENWKMQVLNSSREIRRKCMLIKDKLGDKNG